MTDTINATGHTIRVRQQSGDLLVHPSTAMCLRLVGADVRDWSIPDIEVVQRRFYHDPLLLPPQQDGVLYIVSRKFANAYATIRSDFVFPDTEDAERDLGGRVLAVRRFRRPDVLEM